MRFKIFMTCFHCCLLALACCFPLVAQAQNKTANPDQNTSVIRPADQNASDRKDELELTLDKFKAQVVNAQLDESQLKTVNASLAIVESNLKRAAKSKKQVEVNRQLTDSAQQRADAERELIKQLSEKSSLGLPAQSELATVQRDTSEQLSQAQSELKAIQAAINDRRESSKALQQTIDNLRSQEKDLEASLAEASPITENAVVSEARELEIRSTLQCISAEIDRLIAESKLFEAEDKAGFLIARNELWTAKERRLREFLDLIQARVERQRRSDTQQSVVQAKAEIERVPEALRSFAEENASIAQLATSILGPLNKAQKELKSERLELDQLRKQFVATENRVKAVGLTASVGAYLRNRKSEIPREGWLNPIVVDRLSEIERYQSQQFDLQEAEQVLITDEVVNQVIAEAGGQRLNEKERNQLIAKTTEIVNRRRELIAQAITNHKDYLSTLTNLQNTEVELGKLTATFHEYINERILWIRSNQFLFSKLELDKSDKELSEPQNWLSTGQKLLVDVRRNLLIYLLTAIAFCILFFYRIRLRKAIVSNSEVALRGTNTTFWPTLETALLTIAVALPFPLLLGIVGWRVANIVDGTMLTVAVGRSLVSAGWFFFLGELLRQICRMHGLAASHFGWTASTLAKLNRELAWFVPLGSLLSFTCALLYLIDVHHETDLVERLCFILAITSFAAFLYRIFHPQRGMYREQIASNPKSWIVQSRNIAFWLMMAIPVILIAMIVIGYYYSAIQMLSQLFSTIVALVGLEILRSLVLKFIQLSRRKARIEQSRARLSAQSTHDETDRSAAVVELERAADVETFLASENEAMDENFDRSRKLIAAGIAASWVLAVLIIWADVFPALKGLDRYVFWTTTVDQVVAEDPTASGLSFSMPGTPMPVGAELSKESNGDQRPREEEPSVASTTDYQPTSSDNVSKVAQVKQPVTLRNFLVALFIFSVAIFAVKNLPAFIELVFLKHLPLEQSLRHAIRAISGYVILMIGVIAAGRAMYIGWNQIQWLATALTFGLAFGLQEIFANFIAGIILLLERPIRIGDIVEVDEISGVVTKIRIRATTIRNFDQKEYVIPNKEFITGRLLNWTLADKIIRQTIRVGIAYGADVRRAKKIIRDICESHPHVLEDPKAVITFEAFGDSSLNLSARIFLKDFDSWWPTMDDINLAIDDEFKKAGIEIAFPQRDLHIRSASPNFEQAITRTMSHRSDDLNRAGSNGSPPNENDADTVDPENKTEVETEI